MSFNAWDNPVTQKRLDIEARQHNLGVIGNRETATDTARVEVSYEEPNGVPHAGYFVVHVGPDVQTDDEEYWHPIDAATVLTHARLESMAETRGWGSWHVDDVYAY